ncbi:MAG: 4Fe-4S ferredoxin, partial [Anaerolineae bacterium]|nr:4Fe-4S ferredoxin [Anaerolineae bacterium]
NEMIAKGKDRVADLQAAGHVKANLYGEHELGGLHRLYVLIDEPSAYGLPAAPRYATSGVAAQWLSGVLTAGVLAAVPFWLLFKRQRAQEASEGGE